MKYALPVLALALLGSAAAQVVGIPDSDLALVNMVIALLAGMLVKPLTAIVKKLGNTHGVTTVSISIGLSLVAAFGYAYLQAQGAGENLSVWQTLFIALIAFLKANGDYISSVFAAKKAEPVIVVEGVEEVHE